ncbi:hypothetical protein BDV29DRAFT_173527 [Aspergillus leporis]|uniref:Uncharacterized protein n=1 Tax=Aspergillus leporis TaxID=41062 RepID=A0A5N5X1E0_9EURO|nr:hypothetical protein BDV29DRAFT_173527 [Aspergillus leporis]
MTVYDACSCQMPCPGHTGRHKHSRSAQHSCLYVQIHCLLLLSMVLRMYIHA